MSCRAIGALLTVIAVGVTASASAQVSWPSEAPPRPLPARPVSFPQYEIRTLDNGLQVVAVLHHEQPIVSMRLIVRAGAAQDPRGKAGLANLAASLLDQGTAAATASEVNDAIDFIGGSIAAGAGADLTFANVVVMKDSVETGMRLLSDMARRPAFTPEEVERQRQQALSSLRVNLEDPEFVADAVIDRLVYGLHPYGQPQMGTPDTLASITREDLLAYHRRYFVPNNAILAIVGDVTAAEAFEGVTKVFGDWQRQEIVWPSLSPPPEPTRRVVVINKPGAVQTEVRVGQIGIPRGNADYMALNMALRILGGEGANRLHQVLRTERGLTYGVQANFDTLLDSGDFETSTNTRSEATGEVLRLIVDQFWRLQRERVGERELAGAKDYLTGSFPLTIETPDAIATQVLNVLFYGLAIDQLQSFRERVAAVRSEDIERVARYYLQPERLSVVLVGDAKAFTSQLRGIGFGTYEMVEMRDLDLVAFDFKRRSAVATAPGDVLSSPPVDRVLRYQPPTVQSARSQPAARQLLAEVIAAKGGLERLRNLTSLVVTSQARELGPNASPGPIVTVTTIGYPNRVRIETRGERGDVVQVYDGSQAWVRDGSGVRDVPARMISDLENGLKRDIIASLLAAQDGRITARLLPELRSSADPSLRRTQALEFSGPGLEPMVLYIDADTHLVVRQTYVPAGMGPLIEEVFEDFRMVDGVQIAFKATVRVKGEPVLERRVSEVAINRRLAPSVFARPAP